LVLIDFLIPCWNDSNAYSDPSQNQVYDIQTELNHIKLVVIVFEVVSVAICSHLKSLHVKEADLRKETQAKTDFDRCGIGDEDLGGERDHKQQNVNNKHQQKYDFACSFKHEINDVSETRLLFNF